MRDVHYERVCLRLAFVDAEAKASYSACEVAWGLECHKVVADLLSWNLSLG